MALLAKSPEDRPDARTLAAALDALTEHGVPTPTRRIIDSNGTAQDGAGRPVYTLLSRLTVPGGTSSVAFSPDGRILACGGKAVRLWDARSAEQRGELTWHDRRLSNTRSVAFSPDGRTLAGARNKVICLWDVHTCEPERKVTGYTGWLTKVDSVAFSPDGQCLAGASNDGVRLWDAHTGEELVILAGESAEEWVTSVAFSPDGRRLVGVADERISLWDVRTGEQIFSLTEGSPTEPLCSVAFSPDGRTLATGGGNQLHLRDALTGERRQALAGLTGLPEDSYKGSLTFVNSVAFSPDGRVLASGGDDSAIRLWDLYTGEELVALAGPDTEFGVSSVAFSPDGQRLASGSADGICLWTTHP